MVKKVHRLSLVCLVVAGLFLLASSLFKGEIPARAAAALAGKFTRFNLHNYSGEPRYIALGPDGNMWFTMSNANVIGRITSHGAITEFPIPLGRYPTIDPVGIALAPGGNLWFTESYIGKIGMVTSR
jgi:streptogramin lyase